MDEYNDLEDLARSADEGLNIDLKQAIAWDDLAREEKCCLVKDFLAMANTKDGGKLIIGRRDSDGALDGLSEDQVAKWDQTKVNDFLRNYADPPFAVAVRKLTVDGHRIILLDVPEYQETPILCSRNAHSSQGQSRQLLKSGTLYVRTERATSESISNSQEMREFLNRAVRRRADEMLSDIQQILSGATKRNLPNDEEQYEKEVNETEGFLSQVLKNNNSDMGFWTVRAEPVGYNSDRISELADVHTLVEKAKVSLRGWPYPHVNQVDVDGVTGNFAMGFQSHTHFNRFDEAFRAYTSGLFLWRRFFWEDVEGRNNNGRPILSLVSAIYAILEYFLFLSRYSYELGFEAEWRVSIRASGTNNRALVSIDPSIYLPGLYVCKSDSVEVCSQLIDSTTLRASYQDLALHATKRLFHAFNWTGSFDQTIGYWQQKLLTRDF